MLKKLKVRNKFKNIAIYSLILLVLLFLFVVLLDRNYNISLYFISLACGMSSLVIGTNDSLSINSLSFGKTRHETEKDLIKSLLTLSIYTIVLIGFDILFVYIVYNDIKIHYSFIILAYLLSIILCLLIVFIRMCYKNKLLLLIPLIIVLIIVGIMFIKSKIIVDIVLVVLIIALYFINRYFIYNFEIK